VPADDDLVNPVVSLVVIAFNEAIGAPRAIEAILKQDSDVPFEVLFVDDGSTDATVANVERAAGSDPRFRVIRLPKNEGRGAARSAGVAAARGRTIGFIDADCIVPSDWLARCLRELPGHAAVGGIAVPGGHTAVVSRMTGARARITPGSLPITGANVLFEAGVLQRFPFDPADRLGEDFRHTTRLLKAGERLKRVPGLVVRHEEHKPYGKELRWRFDNGVDASQHMRSRRLRVADASWLLWIAAWVVGIGGEVAGFPAAWLVPLGATIAIGLVHAISRFDPSPAGPFVLACLLDVPVVTMYLAGRTVGVFRPARRSSPA